MTLAPARNALKRLFGVRPSEPIEGVYLRSPKLANGCSAVIEGNRDFTLVPWRPVLERRLGKQVSGFAHGAQSPGPWAACAAGCRFHEDDHATALVPARETSPDSRPAEKPPILEPP